MAIDIPLAVAARCQVLESARRPAPSLPAQSYELRQVSQRAGTAAPGVLARLAHGFALAPVSSCNSRKPSRPVTGDIYARPRRVGPRWERSIVGEMRGARRVGVPAHTLLTISGLPAPPSPSRPEGGPARKGRSVRMEGEWLPQPTRQLHSAESADLRLRALSAWLSLLPCRGTQRQTSCSTCEVKLKYVAARLLKPDHVGKVNPPTIQLLTTVETKVP